MKLAWVASVLLTLPLMGCGGGGSGTSTSIVDSCTSFNNDTFDCATMLQDTSTVIAQTATAVKTGLIQLDTDIGSYCDAQDNTTLTIAQTQWTTTMAAVQQLEVMQIDDIEAARGDIYNWPLNDTCKVDLQISLGETADITQVASGRRGLNAIEYILFQETTLQSCADIYSEDVAPWLANNTIDHKKERCDYAKLVSADLITRATQLETQVLALDLAAQYDSLQAAANAVSDALFYVDKQTKDAKLKAALPQSGDGVFNEAVLESKFANISKEHIKNNLLGAKAILTANGAMGLEDYITAKGQASLATDMITALDDAITNLDAITGDFYTQIAAASDVAACINTAGNGSYVGDSDIESICALQFNIKTFTDLLKGKFTATLEFTTPAEADGDND